MFLTILLTSLTCDACALGSTEVEVECPSVSESELLLVTIQMTIIHQGL